MTDDRGSDLTILVPMLGRPHRVAPLLESIYTATPRAEVLFCLTPTDGEVLAAVAEAEERYAGEARHITVPYRRGDYARKVNEGYRQSGRPLLFLGADDLTFHPGWYEAAVSRLALGIGVVGTNDLGSPRVMAGEHATHSLVTRAYVDEFGTIDQQHQVLCELYWHDFVDDELVATAKSRNVWAFALDSHVEHLHPNWGKAPMDDSYRQQGRRIRAGRALYNRRRRMWT